MFAIELDAVPWFARLVGAIDLGSLIVAIMVASCVCVNVVCVCVCFHGRWCVCARARVVV